MMDAWRAAWPGPSPGPDHAAMSAPSSRFLKPFYRLRFIATGMSMLSAVLLPWLVYTATQRIAAAGMVMLIEASVRLLMSLYGGPPAPSSRRRPALPPPPPPRPRRAPALPPRVHAL